MNKCVFLDRDGVLNKDFVDYVYSEDKLFFLPGVSDAISSLKKNGYLIIVITNQSGISQGIYTEDDMHNVHRLMQIEFSEAIDEFYFAPGHPSVSESLSRKPGSLMFERAIAKYDIDISTSWMVGDKDRDLIPARKLKLRTIQVDHSDSTHADFKMKDLPEAVNVILRNKQ